MKSFQKSLIAIVLVFCIMLFQTIYVSAATKTIAPDKSFLFVTNQGALCSVTTHIRMTQDYTVGSSTTAYYTRTAYLGWQQSGNASIDTFAVTAPEYRNSSGSSIQTFSWTNDTVIVGPDTNVAIAVSNLSQVIYNNTNTNIYYMGYILGGSSFTAPFQSGSGVINLAP